jgi:hypothetical protein
LTMREADKSSHLLQQLQHVHFGGHALVRCLCCKSRAMAQMRKNEVSEIKRRNYSRIRCIKIEPIGPSLGCASPFRRRAPVSGAAMGVSLRDCLDLSSGVGTVGTAAPEDGRTPNYNLALRAHFA